MRYTALFILIFFISVTSFAQANSITRFMQPDSIKAVQFMVEINVKEIKTSKETFAGIKTDDAQLALESEGKEKEIVFQFPATAKVMATGLGVDASEAGELEWKYNWSLNETYRLLMSIASDSAANFILYSGYVWLPKENKWKLIGTCKIEGRWGNIKEPATFHSAKNKKQLKLVSVQTGSVWLQRSNGRWKNLNGNDSIPPVVTVVSHIDSIQQYMNEIEIIKNAIASGKTDAKEFREDIYYTMMKEGTGKQVSLTDTVVVYYMGYLLSDGSIFDQTKDKPAIFPLNRLIKGWHIGVPLCKVGGKIKIVIPSALGYSIRTRAAKIPPNSILVFEVEVVETKPKL